MSTTEKGPRARARRHDWIDERTRAIDVKIAEILREHPELVQIARDNLDRWEKRRGIHPADLEWREILRLPLPELLNFLVEDSERANRLRQSSPFTGILSPEERMAIIEHYETL